ncbi:MAG: hypothetical protein CVU56_12850 [Deltaproteobacteria bacterium HGW-Deltaproteobacteria-14]|jgi:hypothetical protein|nr:MAG: hypothetical protein CVU56_12850 [Deltaproteobacteria bacterium HGW-Deltaproteobacteria-14]
MPDATQTVRPEGETTPERRPEARGSTGGSSRMNVQLKGADYEAGANYLSPGGGAAAALRPPPAPIGAPVQMEKTEGTTPTEGTQTTEGATTPETTTEAPDNAPASVTKTTDYGKFIVYPDDFVGPLPVNDRAADTWTLHQKDYDELIAKLDAVKGGTSKIKLSGDATFKSGTLLDLGWLMTVGVGQQLIGELAAASFTTTIEKTDGGNACGYDPDADSWETTDTPPQKGPGANATVYYNPARLQIGDGAGWKTRPPAIGLAHELVHAWTAVNGQRARGVTEGTNNRELQAVGLGAYKDAVISENQFRAAFGLPTRPVY